MNALLATAFLMGVAGSAHCVGMCGPIALAVPSMGSGNGARMASTALLNAGRITVYVLLGLAFGSFGEGLRLVGLQRGVSITAGILLIVAALVPAAVERLGAQSRLAIFISRLRSIMSRQLRRTSPEAIFLGGALNGLLPCGLVYGAAIGAAATGSLVNGALFMLLFGAGTIPALVIVRSGGNLLRGSWRMRLRRLAPVIMACMGLLLILRGSRLDIPYLSPYLTADPMAITACP